jgi:hypothetical protein
LEQAPFTERFPAKGRPGSGNFGERPESKESYTSVCWRLSYTGFQPNVIKALWGVENVFGLLPPAPSHKKMQLPLTHGNKLDIDKSLPCLIILGR